jgi:hypothetical protein
MHKINPAPFLAFLFICQMGISIAARASEKEQFEYKTDTLAHWRYTMDREYQAPFSDSVKPVARIVFWSAKPAAIGADQKQGKNAWTPDISFELFNLSDLTWCKKKSEMTKSLSSCKPPGVGGDLYVVGNYVFLNREVCVNCIDHSTQKDYCRPVMNYLFNKLNKTQAHTLDELAKQLDAHFPVVKAGLKKAGLALLPLKKGNYWIYANAAHPEKKDTVFVTGLELIGKDTVYLYGGKPMMERGDTVFEFQSQRRGNAFPTVQYVPSARTQTYSILIGGDAKGERKVTKLEEPYKSHVKLYHHCFKFEDGLETLIFSKGIGVIEQSKPGATGTQPEHRYLIGYKVQ